MRSVLMIGSCILITRLIKRAANGETVSLPRHALLFEHNHAPLNYKENVTILSRSHCVQEDKLICKNQAVNLQKDHSLCASAPEAIKLRCIHQDLISPTVKLKACCLRVLFFCKTQILCCEMKSTYRTTNHWCNTTSTLLINYRQSLNKDAIHFCKNKQNKASNIILHIWINYFAF